MRFLNLCLIFSLNKETRIIGSQIDCLFSGSGPFRLQTANHNGRQANVRWCDTGFHYTWDFLPNKIKAYFHKWESSFNSNLSAKNSGFRLSLKFENVEGEILGSEFAKSDWLIDATIDWKAIKEEIVQGNQ